MEKAAAAASNGELMGESSVLSEPKYKSVIGHYPSQKNRIRVSKTVTSMASGDHQEEPVHMNGGVGCNLIRRASLSSQSSTSSKRHPSLIDEPKLLLPPRTPGDELSASNQRVLRSSFKKPTTITELPPDEHVKFTLTTTSAKTLSEASAVGVESSTSSSSQSSSESRSSAVRFPSLTVKRWNKQKTTYPY